MEIELACRTCHRLIAVGVDPEKIEVSRRNATAHGVTDRIDFRVSNSFDILSRVKATSVVTSPLGRLRHRTEIVDSTWTTYIMQPPKGRNDRRPEDGA